MWTKRISRIVDLFMNTHYELLCIFPGTLAEDELPKIVDAIEKLITDNGGTNIQKDDMGKNRLAYPIKQIRYGYFSLFTFQNDSESMPVFQAKLRLMPNILRTLLSSFDPTVKQALKDRLATLKERMDASGIKPPTSRLNEDDDAEEEVQEVVKPKAKKVPAAEAPKTEIPKMDNVASEPPKESPAETPINMTDIDKKLDELLDDTMAAL